MKCLVLGRDGFLGSHSLELCASAELRQSLGRPARESVVAECSADTIYARTMELYRFALGRGQGTGIPN